MNHPSRGVVIGGEVENGQTIHIGYAKGADPEAPADGEAPEAEAAAEELIAEEGLTFGIEVPDDAESASAE